MLKNKIAFQGELGAYSHIACNELFNNVEVKTCNTFEETFKTAYEDDSYKILGLKKGCSKNEILKAAAKLQKKIHPDVNRDVNTEELSKLVNEAKEKLLKELT